MVLFINLNFQDLALAIADNAVKNSALLTTKAFELLKDYYAQQEREAEENFLQLVTERFQEVVDPSKALPKYSLTQKGELAQLKIAAQYQQFLESDEYRRGVVFDGGSDLSKKRKEVDLGDDLDDENSSKQKHKKTDFNETSANTSLDEALAIQEFFNINPLLKQSQIPDSTQKYENLSDWINPPSPASPQANQESQGDKSILTQASSGDIKEDREESLLTKEEEEKKETPKTNPKKIKAITAIAKPLLVESSKSSAIARITQIHQLSSTFIRRHLLMMEKLAPSSSLLFPIQLPNGQFLELLAHKKVSPSNYELFYFDPSTNPSELTENYEKLTNLLITATSSRAIGEPCIKICLINIRRVITDFLDEDLGYLDNFLNVLEFIHEKESPDMCEKTFKPMKNSIKISMIDSSLRTLFDQNKEPIRLDISAQYQRFLKSDGYRQAIFKINQTYLDMQHEDCALKGTDLYFDYMEKEIAKRKKGSEEFPPQSTLNPNSLRLKKSSLDKSAGKP